MESPPPPPPFPVWGTQLRWMRCGIEAADHAFRYVWDFPKTPNPLEISSVHIKPKRIICEKGRPTQYYDKVNERNQDESYIQNSFLPV